MGREHLGLNVTPPNRHSLTIVKFMKFPLSATLLIKGCVQRKWHCGRNWAIEEQTLAEKR